MKHLKPIFVTTLLTSALLFSGIASASKYYFNVCIQSAGIRNSSGQINATITDYLGTHTGKLQAAPSYCGSDFTYITSGSLASYSSLKSDVAISPSKITVYWTNTGTDSHSGTCDLPAAYAVPITFYPYQTSDYKSSKKLLVTVIHDATQVTGCTSSFQ